MTYQELLTPIPEDKDYPSFTTEARMNSLHGGYATVTVIGERMDGNQRVYIIRYKDLLCTMIFNPFSGDFYADDVYGKRKEVN